MWALGHTIDGTLNGSELQCLYFTICVLFYTKSKKVKGHEYQFYVV